MANNVVKVNGIAIANIAKINGQNDSDLAKLNGEEFTGYNPTEAHTLIATQTASGSATLEFTSGIDSTYDVYEFIYTNMHPATDEVNFSFQVNASGGSGFNEYMTTTFFRPYHGEGGGTELLYTYEGRHDQAQTQLYQPLAYGTGNENDQSCSGMLTLYNPSSTTFVKQFAAKTNDNHAADYTLHDHVFGYINTASAIDEISFKFHSGNIDTGFIKMYGVATS
jgi:hypothetical protein